MLHIRLTFIGIKTGWTSGKKCLGAQLAPGEKMLSFVPVDCVLAFSAFELIRPENYSAL